MKTFLRFLSACALIATASTAVALAAVKVEGTPAPTRPKPDFSSMKFLLGTWQCTEWSSRRPGPFEVTEVYTMDPAGYWIVRDFTTHKAAWIPREFHNQSKYTYDDLAKRWVRITIGEEGYFQIATAPMPTGSTKTYTFTIETKTPDVASYAPEVYTKVSDTKKTMTTSFSETNGRVANVKETCTKS